MFGLECVFAVLACVAAPVSFGASSVPAAPEVPWVRADGVRGYLFYYSGGAPMPSRATIYTHGAAPGSRSTKILWYARNGGFSLRVAGFRLDAPGAFAERFRLAQNGFYPSIVVVPAPGCWRFTVTSGHRRGRFAFIAVDR
jgi:hypothetical protein